MSKALTRKQLQGRKEKAVCFVRDVLQDDDHADEIEDESLEDYADRRKVKLLNLRGESMATKQELLDRIKELEDENEELQDQLDDIADIVAPPEEGDGQEEVEGEE